MVVNARILEWRMEKCLPEDLSIELSPVGDTAVQTADMDEVEIVLWICPLQLGIIEFEFHVWWNEERLDGGEVGANHNRGRMGVSKVAGSKRLVNGSYRRLPGERGMMKRVLTSPRFQCRCRHREPFEDFQLSAREKACRRAPMSTCDGCERLTGGFDWQR